MPPKRKAPVKVDSSGPTPRVLKIAKKKQTTAMEKSELVKLKKWFEKYADSDNKEVISHDGCQAFFSDVGVSLESMQPLVLGYKLNAAKMGFITWNEWFQGMKSLAIHDENVLEFKKMVDLHENFIKSNPAEFKKFYTFTYNYTKSEGQKSMDIETTCALWGFMLAPEYPIVNSFIQFIQEKKPVKVINKDQWSSMLDFCMTVPNDLQNYDSSASWPVLFDEYVEWRQSL